MKAPQTSHQCVNCQLTFPEEGLYISHYRSEHHRYNIKRKFIGLPPLPFDQFNLRTFYGNAEYGDEKTSNHSVTQDLYCQICSKKFMSAGTYKQHLGSKRHRENRNQLKTNNNQVMSKSSSASSFQITGAERAVSCVFCHSEGSKEHLRLKHNFPPFEDECINREGLLAKVQSYVQNHQCLYCHLKFQSEQSVRQHMKDLAHDKIDIQNFGEYQHFYMWKIQESSSESEESEDHFQNLDQSSHYQQLTHPTLEELERKRMERINFSNTGVIINGKQVGYRHLKTYYKQYLNREIKNQKAKYQPALENNWQEGYRQEKAPKIALVAGFR